MPSPSEASTDSPVDSRIESGADRRPREPDPSFVAAVLEVVESIPPGRVMAYGDVAAVLGSRAARAVGTVMARYGSDVPWWRVVRASGQPPVDHDERAEQHYLAEATPLVRTPSGYRIALRTARWSPLDD